MNSLKLADASCEIDQVTDDHIRAVSKTAKDFYEESGKPKEVARQQYCFLMRQPGRKFDAEFAYWADQIS